MDSNERSGRKRKYFRWADPHKDTIDAKTDSSARSGSGRSPSQPARPNSRSSQPQAKKALDPTNAEERSKRGKYYRWANPAHESSNVDLPRSTLSMYRSQDMAESQSGAGAGSSSPGQHSDSPSEHHSDSSSTGHHNSDSSLPAHQHSNEGDSHEERLLHEHNASQTESDTESDSTSSAAAMGADHGGTAAVEESHREYHSQSHHVSAQSSRSPEGFDFEEGQLPQSPSDYLNPQVLEHLDTDDSYSEMSSDGGTARDISLHMEETQNEEDQGEQDIETHSLERSSQKRFSQLLSAKNKEAISETVIASPSEIFLNVLTLVQKHNLSHTIHANIMQLLNSLFRTPVLPDSRYLLDKMYMSNAGVNLHFFCCSCNKLFENISFGSNDKICDNCQSRNSFHDLTKSSYFVSMDLGMQVESILKQPTIGSKLINPKDFVSEKTCMKDLHDGEVYRQYASSLPLDDCTTFISLTMCVDGSPLFVSSTGSVWPLLIMINELPPLIRMENLVLGGLWFGKEKPPLDLFLKPFVDQLLSLSDFGTQLCICNEIRFVKMYLIAACVDSGVRGSLQGIHQFNGEYGCSFCLHPGEIEKQGTSVRKYPYLRDPAPLRTEEDLERDANIVAVMRPLTASARRPHINGVIKAGPLLPAPKFKNIKGMILDYLHALCYGTGRQIGKLWLGTDGIVKDDRGKVPDYYIGSPADLDKLDERFRNLTPPVEVRRLPRVMSECIHWKAREWENFILYYSYPVLKGILPDRYINHWALFSQALYILLQTTITLEDLNTADVLLNTFCDQLVNLYPNSEIPLKNMTYNIHLMIHVCDNARRWGPAWAVSSFAFEDGNGKVVKMVHADRGLPNQIVRSMCEKTAQNFLKHEIASPRSQEFIDRIECKQVETCVYVGDTKLFGRKSSLLPSDEESWLLNHHNLNQHTHSFIIFHKLIYDGFCLKTQSSSATNNTIFALKDGRIFKLKKILCSQDIDEVYLLGCLVRTRACVEFPVNITSPFIQQVVLIEEELNLLKVTDLLSVCAYTKINRRSDAFVSIMPNVMNVC